MDKKRRINGNLNLFKGCESNSTNIYYFYLLILFINLCSKNGVPKTLV